MSETEIQALLAECALQMIARREHLKASGRTNLLMSYLNEEISFDGYEFLVDALLPDKGAAISYIAQNPELFVTEYVYAESEDVLGNLYLSCRNKSSRKATGSYYTPAAIAGKMVEHLSEKNDLEGRTIFDPCCGTGTFLMQMPEEISIENIYGNDIDAIAVYIARINLALKYRTTDRELLCSHISCKDYLSFEKKEYYDFIIGNPPWGYHFSEEEKRALREKYRCARGSYVESYDVFTEQALSNLKCGGVLSFLLPEAILNVRSHRGIRELLMEENSFQYLEYMGEVFAYVQCPCIILQILHNHRQMDCMGMTVHDGARVFTICTERRLQSQYFSFTATDEEYWILMKIEHVKQKATLAGNAVFALGIVTGNNKKYITHEKTAENEVILKGLDIQKFRCSEGNNYIKYQPELFQQTAPTEYYRAEQKLLYRFICRRLVFAYDDRQTLSLNSCNILIPEIEGLDIKYILAVLNSSVAQFYFEKSFQSVKVLRSHIEQIPIPMVGKAVQEEIIRLADRMIKPCPEDDAEEIFGILDNRIAQIYGLSQEEYEVVKHSVENLE